MERRLTGCVGHVGYIGKMLVAIHNLVCARKQCRPEKEKGKDYCHDFHLYKYKAKMKKQVPEVLIQNYS